MVWQKDYYLFDKVAVHTCHKVLIEVDNNSALIVGTPEGILG
jgi:hypothetical protein